MAVIDPDGLFRGKRLRRCSPMARLYWPYLFGLANSMGRIELDYDIISDEFASFREQAPTAEQIESYFREYEVNKLIFLYGANKQHWGQWDTKRYNLKRHKLAADLRTPGPSEEQYREWLFDQHGEEWHLFHWNKDLENYAPGGGALVLHQTSLKLPETLPKSDVTVSEDSRLGIGSRQLAVGNGKQPPTPADEITPDMAVRKVAEELNVTAVRDQREIFEAIKLRQKKHGGTAEYVADEIVKAWAEYSSAEREVTYGPVKFITQGIWLKRDSWAKPVRGSPSPPPPNPAEIKRRQLRREAEYV